MNLENKKRAAYGRLIMLIIPLLFVIALSVAIFMNLYADLVVLSSITLIFATMMWFINNLKLNYLNINIDDEMLTIRYFSVSPISSSPKMIEIPLASLQKFVIEKSFMGIRYDLILYRKTPRGVAKYPPISITLLSDDDFQLLTKKLNEIINSQANQ